MSQRNDSTLSRRRTLVEDKQDNSYCQDVSQQFQKKTDFYNDSIIKNEALKTNNLMFKYKQSIKDIKKLEQKIDSTLNFKPTNASEYVQEQKQLQKKEQLVKENKDLGEMLNQQFRLLQKPEYASPFAKAQLDII